MKNKSKTKEYLQQNKNGVSTTKSTKGITLIALVITIVVLLILTGVVIAAIAGDNGILSRATDSRAITALGEAKEKCALIATEAMQHYYDEMYVKQTPSGTMDEKVVAALKEKMGANNLTKGVTLSIPNEDTGTGATVTLLYIGNYTAKVEGTVGDGKIEWGEIINNVEKVEEEHGLGENSENNNSGEDAENFTPVEGSLLAMYLQAVEDECDGTNCQSPNTHLHIGDYVDYVEPTTVASDVIATDPANYSSTGYTSPESRNGYDDQTYTLDNSLYWRVLGLSQDGQHVLLTTYGKLDKGGESWEDRVFILQGAKGVALNYGISELNKICAIYKNNYADEVRSMNIDDVNRLLGVTVNAETGIVTDSHGSNIDEIGTIGTTETYISEDFGEDYLYESPEEYIAGNSTAYFNKVNEYYEYLFDTSSVGPDSRTINDVLVCDDVNSSDFISTYWLASRLQYNGDYPCEYIVCTHGFETINNSSFWLFNAFGGESYNGAMIKPLVTLRSEVLESQVPKIANPNS